MGKNPHRTVLVEVGKLRPFSDIAGRHTLRWSDSSEKRQELANRLKAAGCEVNLTGTDWHKSGNFNFSLPDISGSAKQTHDNQPTSETIRLLQLMSEIDPKGVDKQQLQQKSGMEPLDFEFHIDELKRLGFARQGPSYMNINRGRVSKINLTPEGRAHLISIRDD